MNGPICRSRPDRVLFGMAGTLTAVSAALAATVSPWFLLITGFVAANQLLYAAAGACPASLILGRICRNATAVTE